MQCRTPSCPNPGRYEGYCPWCVNTLWKVCGEQGCDQYTMDKSDRCFAHRDPQDYLSAQQAGDLLGLSSKSVQRLADGGKIPCARTDGGHRRFRKADVIHYLESLKGE